MGSSLSSALAAGETCSERVSATTLPLNLTVMTIGSIGAAAFAFVPDGGTPVEGVDGGAGEGVAGEEDDCSRIRVLSSARKTGGALLLS